MAERIIGFAPIAFDNSKYLLLGTLPGAKSLKEGYYYADGGNYFWKFFAKYSGTPIPYSMAEASDVLRKVNVAVWDVYESGIRLSKEEKATSKDSDIRDAVPNDIRGFLKQHPNIKKIGALGKPAYKHFCELYPDIEAVPLPSTSGANGASWGTGIAEDHAGWIEWTRFLE